MAQVSLCLLMMYLFMLLGKLFSKLNLNYPVQDQVATVGEWYDTNEFCVNTENNSNVLLVHTKRSRKLPDLSINLNQSKLKQVTTMKYLGNQLNKHLS